MRAFCSLQVLLLTSLLWAASNAGPLSMLLKRIHFTQNSLGCMTHDGIRLTTSVNNLLKGKEQVDKIPMIRVYEYQGKMWSVDNRRLWIFKHAFPHLKRDDLTVDFLGKVGSHEEGLGGEHPFSAINDGLTADVDCQDEKFEKKGEGGAKNPCPNCPNRKKT